MIAVWASAAPFLSATLATLDAAGPSYVLLPEELPAPKRDDVDVLIVGGEHVTADVLDRFPHVKLVVRGGTGIDRIDLSAASQRGVTVTNVRDYATNEVADHTLLLLLAVSRSLTNFRESVRQNWVKVDRPPVIRLHGSRMGIIGLGRIGTAVAERARSLGMDVVAHDPLTDSASFAKADVASITFDDLLATSDVITLHTPLTTCTWHLLDQAAFDRMRRSPYVINTARGELIDTAALVRALDSGAIRGAGLDVLEDEPDVREHSTLLDRDNVIVTPHIAWYSQGAEEQLGHTTAQLAIDYVQGGALPPALNPKPAHEVTA